MADLVIASSLCSKPDAFFEAAKEETGLPTADGKSAVEKEHFVMFFGAEVVDYYCDGDENNYNDHIFKLRVWVGQRMYFITRSYSAFCELDAIVRKKFPRTVIPPIPLAGAPAFIRMTSFSQRAYMANNDPASSNSAASTASSAQGSSASRKSIAAAGGSNTDRYTLSGRKSSATSSPAVGIGVLNRPKTYSSRRNDKHEIIPHKKRALTEYLSKLFLLPEILLADCVLYFLDEESVDGQIISKSEANETINEVDILLANEGSSSKVVLRQLQLPFEIANDSVVVWKFSTLYYDIGFSVKLGDTVILPYQRYHSCVEPVKGSVYIPNQGTLTLTWDNSYSRMRSKSLSYTVRIISKSSFDTATLLAQQAESDRNVFVRHRNQLRKYLLQTSKNLLSVSVAKGSSLESTGMPDISMSGHNVVSLGLSSVSERNRNLSNSSVDSENENENDNESESGNEHEKEKEGKGSVNKDRNESEYESDYNTESEYKSESESKSRNCKHSRNRQRNQGQCQGQGRNDGYEQSDIEEGQVNDRVNMSNNGQNKRSGGSALVICRLEDERRSLMHALASAERALAEERGQSASIRNSFDELTSKVEILSREKALLELRVETLLMYADQQQHSDSKSTNGNIAVSSVTNTDDNSNNSSVTDAAEAVVGSETKGEVPPIVRELQLNASDATEASTHTNNDDDNIEEQSVNNTNAIVEELSQSNAEKDKEISNLSARLQALYNRNTYLEDLILSLQSDKEENKKQTQQQSQAISKLKTEKKTLKEYVTKIKGELEAANMELKTWKDTEQQQQKQKQDENKVELQAVVSSEEGYGLTSAGTISHATNSTGLYLEQPSMASSTAPSSMPINTVGDFNSRTNDVCAPATIKKRASLLDNDMDEVGPSNITSHNSVIYTYPKKRLSMLGAEEEDALVAAQPLTPSETGSTVSRVHSTSACIDEKIRLPPTPSEIDLSVSEQQCLGYFPAAVSPSAPPTAPAESTVAAPNQSTIAMPSPTKQTSASPLEAPSQQLTRTNSTNGAVNININKPIISDETVELVDDMILETSVAMEKAISSIWEFGKAFVATTNTTNVSTRSNSSNNNSGISGNNTRELLERSAANTTNSSGNFAPTLYEF